MKELLIALVMMLGLYPTAGVVTDVNYVDDTVTVELQNGNLYAFYGTEDWEEGDIAALLMNSMNTDDVTDDEIVRVRYVDTMK